MAKLQAEAEPRTPLINFQPLLQLRGKHLPSLRQHLRPARQVWLTAVLPATPNSLAPSTRVGLPGSTCVAEPSHGDVSHVDC